MGQQRRYADADARRRFDRQAEAHALIPHALIPRSLSEAERGRRAGAAVRLRARGGVDRRRRRVDPGARIGGARTRRCVLVIRVDSHDRPQEARVLAGAVERVEP